MQRNVRYEHAPLAAGVQVNADDWGDPIVLENLRRQPFTVFIGLDPCPITITRGARRQESLKRVCCQPMLRALVVSIGGLVSLHPRAAPNCRIAQRLFGEAGSASMVPELF